MTVTIKDVARAAGVSVATVSRVLNDSGPVSAETRRRIREVARTMRYAPNSAARSLITSRTSTLGVLLPDLHGEFFSEVIRGIDQAAQERGYHLLVSSSHNAPSEVEAALGAMRGRVDGLVIMTPAADLAPLAEHVPATLPVVLLNSAPGSGGPFDALGVDNRGGAYAMVRHLVAAGRRRVAMVCGPPGNADADERLAGYRAALRDAGAEHRRAWELPGDFLQRSGYAAAERLLALAPRPDALFAANDSMAIGALSALREHGVRVPEDVAVAGFDDIPIARYMSPPLTTVRVDIDGLGARAVAKLVQQVQEARGAKGADGASGASGADGARATRATRDGKGVKGARRRAPARRSGRRETLPAELVVRASCGAGAGRGG